MFKKITIFSYLFGLMFSFVGIDSAYAAEEDQYLRIKDSWVRDGDLDSAKAYVHVLEYGDYIGLNYRFFYPYNGNIGGGGILTKSGAHEGDWEGVKFLIDKNTGKIEEFLPSAHDNEHDWTDATKLEFEDGHPVIYSAEQSHANYWTEGRHNRLSGFGNDYTNKGYLWDIADNNFIIFNDQTTPWKSFSGRWGASGTGDRNDNCGLTCPDSPKGPGAKKGWFRDIVGANANSDVTDLGEEKLERAISYAEEYAPRVYLQNNEIYFPSTVEWLLPQVQLKEDGNILLDKGQVSPSNLVGKTPDPAVITHVSIENDKNVKVKFISAISGGDSVALRREQLYDDGIWRYTDYDVTGTSTWERKSDWDTQYRLSLRIKDSGGNVKYTSAFQYYEMPKPVEIGLITSFENLMVVDLEPNIDRLRSGEYLFIRREKKYPDGTWGYTDYKVEDPSMQVWEREAEYGTEYRVKVLVKKIQIGDVYETIHETDYVYYTMPSE
ncbi:Vps62-related protein [Bacillus sp. 2205SS5-2]|uniref:Vps62-related protein n=1 Tax=Bacillus sp. 2205SS5-2 TaxID=3109031 RepID=UPI003005EF38